MSKSGEYQRADKIRDARRGMAEVIAASKLEYDKDEFGDFDPNNAVVPVAFIEAVAIWLDKVLKSASYGAALPGGEADHGMRVAEGWFGAELGSFYRTGPGAGFTGAPQKRTQGKKEGLR